MNIFLSQVSIESHVTGILEIGMVNDSGFFGRDCQFFVVFGHFSAQGHTFAVFELLFVYFLLLMRKKSSAVLRKSV